MNSGLPPLAMRTLKEVRQVLQHPPNRDMHPISCGFGGSQITNPIKQKSNSDSKQTNKQINKIELNKTKQSTPNQQTQTKKKAAQNKANEPNKKNTKQQTGPHIMMAKCVYH